MGTPIVIPAGERLALLYSEGSLGIALPGAAVATLREDAILSDRNEADPAHFTQVVRVRLEVIEVVETPSAVAAAAHGGACAACGRVHSTGGGR